MSDPFNIEFKVFGQEEGFSTKVAKGSTFLDVFKEMGVFPDDYLITQEGTPVPIDSEVEERNYTLYKVPSGG